MEDVAEPVEELDEERVLEPELARMRRMSSALAPSPAIVAAASPGIR